MGICNSCEGVSAAAAAGAAATPATETAKLVLQDGKLQEFARPVKAAQVVEREPACFVWDADDMVVDGFASAVGAEDELRPGKLYFLLPRSMLRRPLDTGEMAALAVRASVAVALGACRCRCVEEKSAATVPTAVLDAAMPRAKGGVTRRVSVKMRSDKGREFTSELSSIPE